MGWGTRVHAANGLIGPFNAKCQRSRSNGRVDNPRCLHRLESSIALVVELVDTGDSKSPA